ncbi:MotA/TolQ/ExbB proton channel family protein [Pelagicoccus sp. SDUM812005]|uniref:MotA/TolQ/ExbB proton channel family protein n=1 Tax=Pelagicoccus sp. SDUM812005 TaxID=3041257 RepID=UPI00280EF9E2|nr:MotA/TolQ/ExbB proton channel family protein [Pelagicoccus sp. SDUM812005]MDQ8182390.1 MotA/TolQ/ExbB proton channel family protein [Pelagicoccus sp. SDUM812005]
MNKFSKLAVALLVSAMPLMGQSALDTASANAQKKLDASLEKLSDLRESIGKEKIPLTKERDALFAELRDLRRDANRAQRISDNQSSDLSSYEESIKAQGEMVDYLINLSAEFGRTFGSQLDPSEYEFYGEKITASEIAAEDPHISPVEKLEAQKTIIEAGLARMESLSGGATYAGKAITSDGLLEDGTFVRFGPITYFAGKSGTAGLVEQGNSTEPLVMPIMAGEFDAGLLAIASGQEGSLPIDATLDNAMAIEATKESIGEHIGKGGIWVYPILGFAFVSLAVAAFKAFELMSLPKPKEGFLAEVLAKLANKDKEGAAHVANSTSGPMGKMIQQGVKYSDHNPELVEEILYESMVETQPKVMRLLPFISVTAAVAPLLGLLGTVTGMINTFNRIKIFGTGDAKSLSGGISEALITTEFGLIVAIPALLLYAILSRKAKGYLSRMEKMSISFVNGIKTIA